MPCGSPLASLAPELKPRLDALYHPPYSLPSLMIKSLIIIHCMIFLMPTSLHSFMLLILALKILGNKEV